VLVFAFPRLYSAAFSGFYLPLMLVLWLLILRGVSIEFRSHQANPLWRSFWDATFALASTAMAFLLGVSLGNLIRGVPLDASGYFRAPLFTNFRTRPDPGALDWYTLLVGLFAAATLAGHGALFLTWRTEGIVHQRSARIARRCWVAVGLLAALSTAATAFVQPMLFDALLARPWTWPLVLLVLAAAGLLCWSLLRARELAAFLASSAAIAGMLALTAAEMFPIILPSTIDPAYHLTAFNAATGGKALWIGLAWWTPAIALAIAYFAYLFRLFRPKSVPPGESY
jgi:cytochrome d ubiquinol oxidase subunit II